MKSAFNHSSVEVSVHGIHNGLKEGTVGHASVTSGDVPSSSNVTVGQTKDTTIAIYVTSKDVSNVGHEPIMNKFPSSYATKLSPTSLTKANLRKHEVNVPYDADYDVLLHLALVHECPKTTPKRVVNNMDKGKEKTSRNNDKGFVEVKKKKSEVKKKKLGGNNRGTKNFKPVSVKPKTQYRPKAKQSTKGTSNSPKTTPFVGTNKASTSGYNKDSPSYRGSFFSLSNSFEALNIDNLITGEVATGSKATTTVTQEEGQSSTPIVEKINVLEKHILEGKLVLVNDDGKLLEKVDYPVSSDSDDEVESVENEIANFLASEGVGYGLKSL
ncbi:hypothetical protein Tco_0454930 [Tanacetum coccineum]